MAGKFRLQQNNMLEIRGLSRGSTMEQVQDSTMVVPYPSGGMLYFEQPHYNATHLNMDSDEDDDDSTVTGGSGGLRRNAPGSPETEDTITASDTYWSGENSFGTGNTTERSSVYSWGDDEFDHQTSRQVRQMFQAIEQMLFEGVLSGSTSLQHECREWMASFPHMRILGKQMVCPRDDGFQSIPSTGLNSVATSSPASFDLDSHAEGLSIRGREVSVQVVPPHLLPPSESGSSSPSMPPPGGDLSHLREEIIEQDGSVEEYLAFDSREMDDEQARKYHVPRRRRLGFPPITPNACVRDAVLHYLFDQVWSGVVGCLSGSQPGAKASLLKKMLVQDYSLSGDMDPTAASGKSVKSVRSRHLHDKFDLERLQAAGLGASNVFQFAPRNNLEYDDDDYDLHHQHGGSLERSGMFGISSSFLMPSISIPPRSLLYPPDNMLPPSRGNYLDPILSGSRHNSFATGRLSTAPHGNNGDMNSLNDLMTISQKKLQARSERLPIQNEDLLVSPDVRFSVRPSSSQFTHLGNPVPVGGPLTQHLSTIGPAPSPFMPQMNRPVTSRDVSALPGNLARQSSATGKKGRFGKPGRLLPLDGAKTPKADFDGFVRATKLTRPGSLVPPTPSSGGPRVYSPPHAFQPPPTAPNPNTGSSSLWVNPRLPPITSGLESLHENTLLDVKKARGKTAHTRISSAIADDKPVNRGLEFVSRPNTTHTFRADNLAPKRSTSVTPSNRGFGAQGSSISIVQKSVSPSGVFFQNSPGSNSLYPQYSSYSPENVSGLAGITGKSINVLGAGQPSSPDDDPGPNNASWGQPGPNMSASHVRRKRTVLGLT